MSADLAALYREQVLAHSRQPAHFGRLEGADHVVCGSNPLCGDSLQVYLSLDGDQLRELTFEGHGCAISVASASMMTDMLKGTTHDEAMAIIDAVREMLASADETVLAPDIANSPVAALAAVRRYPTRIKCATLAWQAIHSALTAGDDTVSTE